MNDDDGAKENSDVDSLAGAWMVGFSQPAQASVTAAILAGGEIDLPADAPSGRLDTEGEFSFVGAVEVSDGVRSYLGSAVALSRNWVLSAGHNVDLDDNGVPDASWSGSFHLPGAGVFSVAQTFTHASFTGFGNPSVHDDLALLYLADPLPVGMGFPTLGSGAAIGDFVTLVGFGRSGYGSYGYTTNASLTDRRFGSNVIDELRPDDEGSGLAEVFRYDFDAPDSAGIVGGAWGTTSRRSSGRGTREERRCGKWRTAGNWW